MQEKKNKRRALILVVLLGAIIAMVFLQQPKRAFDVDKQIYRNIDLKTVDRVTLESRTGTTDLRFQGYRWKVNDTIDADRGLIEVLFATLQQAEPKRPVAISLRDSVTRAITENGIKVTLYRENEQLKTFYAGGNDAKTQAIFLAERGAEPHLVMIPGYRVYVSGIFEVPAIGWREKLVFNLNWQNFSRLESRYKNPSGNFDVVMEKNQVFIPQIEEGDTAKLNTYLDQVSLLTVEEYISANKITDSLSSTTPVVTITVSDIANRAHQLAIFTAGNEFYAMIDGKIWAKLNQNAILPLLRPKDFFLRR